MKVAIIKYNAGNIQSVANALDRLDVMYNITQNAEEIMKADKVIFPGVGEAKSTMEYLKANKLDQVIVNLNQPVLGICLGMQLMCRHSEENDTNLLGIFDEPVKRFPASENVKVPQMGWNTITHVNGWPAAALEGRAMYFVHSYYVPVNRYSTATTHYTIPFSAAMKRDNYYAVQFHPEKSAADGERVLKLFLDL